MKCPICACEKFTKLFDLCSNLKIFGQNFSNMSSELVCCDGCGLVYVESNAEQVDYSKYYRSDCHNNPSDYEIFGTEATIKYFNDLLQNITPYISAKSYILDIGSGMADFDFFLSKKGFINIFALDTSKKVTDYINSKKTIKAFCKDSVDDMRELHDKFDLIMYIHSLEHIKDIKKSILNSILMLKQSGYLYIDVPDASEYINEKYTSYSMFTYEHLYHFGLLDLINIGLIYGLKVVLIKKYIKANSYGVIGILFKKSAKINAPVKHEDTKFSIMNYINWSSEKLVPYLKEFESSQKPLILWGIGASTALLLNSCFNKCNVIQLIDTNTKRQGIEYKVGKKILKIDSPDKILDSTSTIIVLPTWYRNSIVKQIRSMNIRNPLSFLSK